MNSIEKDGLGAITQKLHRIKKGDSVAYQELYDLVYDHLRFIASMELRNEREGHTMSRTDLVHESFLKMLHIDDIDWQDRRQFFGTASRAMRQVLIDHARKKLSRKRGGRPERVTLDENVLKQFRQSEEIIQIDEALEELREMDPGLAELVDLRFFAGLSMEDIAQMMNVSRSTLQRNWVKARTWLFKEINSK